MVNTIMIYELLKKNTSWIISGEVWLKASTFLVMIMIARSLGDTAFGQYTFIIAYIQLFQIVLDFGLQLIVTRNVSRLQKQDIENQIRILIALKVLLIGVTLVLIAAITFFIDKPADILVLIYAQSIYMVLFSCSDLFRSIFRAREQFHYEGVTKFIEGILLIIFIFIALQDASILRVISAFIATIAISFAITAGLIKKDYKTLSPLFDWSGIKKIIKQAWPLALTAVFVIVYFRIDAVMLSFMQGDEPTGWYNAAYQLIYGPIFIPTFVMLSFMPRLSRLVTTSLIKARRLFRQSLLLMIILAAGLMGIVYLLAPDIILIAYGQEFLPSIPVLRILCIAVFISFIAHVFVFTLTAMNKESLLPLPAAVGMVLNIVLNLLYIPKYSLYAAAWTTVATEAFTALILMALCKKVLFSKTEHNT